MNYLYHGTTDTDTTTNNEWTDLFDLIIVGASKPAFLVDPNLKLFRLNPSDGSLLNTDVHFDIQSYGTNGTQQFLKEGKIFQGGIWQDLTAMLEIEANEEIL